MKEFLKNGWITLAKHPKKVFMYSMIILTISFVGILIQGIFFPKKDLLRIHAPEFYQKSQNQAEDSSKKEREMEKIIRELKVLKQKRDQKMLEPKDSLRIEYLFNQYQKLKNGH